MKSKIIQLILIYITCFSFSFASANHQVSTPLLPTQAKELVSPHILVVMGLTGDLGQRKLIPALYHLFRLGQLPENFVIVGSARRALTPEAFQYMIRESLAKALSPDLHDDTLWEKFMAKCFYHQTDLDHPADYEALNTYLKQLDAQYETHGNRLFYLAVPPSFFSNVITQLYTQNLIPNDNKHTSAPWGRIMVEKPFGHDWQSACELQKHISQYFDDSQIYLIDHFLGKEVVQNLLTLRFSNPLFAHAWNRQFIEHIQINFSEDIGVGTRGAFWEETGLLRDMVQNHLIQLVALIAMEPPTTMEAQVIREAKTDVIKSIRPFNVQQLDQQIIRGQYGLGLIQNETVPGYREEAQVDPLSKVETFVAAKFLIDNKRWQGVPFYLSAGKRLAERKTEIVITFKSGKNEEQLQPNQLVIRVQPDAEIYLTFNSKQPGINGEVGVVKMSFNYDKDLQVPIPDAYEVLLFEAMRGQIRMFAGLEEILASWNLFTPVLKAWQDEPAPTFPNYAAGTWGPEESLLLLEEGHVWHTVD